MLITVVQRGSSTSNALLSRLWLALCLLSVAAPPASAQSLPGGNPNAAEQVRFYHTDALGSVRAVTDLQGQVVSRSDFLPFGEEMIPAETGREGLAGYGEDAGNKQKFTGKERDVENGLDYFGARYFSGAQGRFTSADPMLASADHIDPQSWNRYSYGLNNPLRYSDPLGLYVWDSTLGGEASDDELRRQLSKKEANRMIGRRNDIRGALAAGAKINNPRVQAALAAYGKEGEANGVAVASAKLGGSIAGQVSAGNPPIRLNADGKSGVANVLVTFDPSSGGQSLVIAATHEGQHVLDRQAFVGAAFSDPAAFDGPLNLTGYQTEFGAYRTGAATARGLGINIYAVGKYELWNSGWARADQAALESRGINRLLADPKGNYKLTPQNPGSKLFPK